MVEAKDLKGRVISYIGAGGKIGHFSDSTKKKLVDAKALFELAPDEYIDTGRLPSSVTSLSTLVDYLKTIKEKLAKRDNAVENKDWNVAKSGQLRLYKLFVCNIHALSDYASDDSANFQVAAGVLAVAACGFGKANPPVGLSAKGKTMWDKTYGDSQPRTIATMKTLVFLCKDDSKETTNTDEPKLDNQKQEGESGTEGKANDKDVVKNKEPLTGDLKEPPPPAPQK